MAGYIDYRLRLREAEILLKATEDFEEVIDTYYDVYELTKLRDCFKILKRNFKSTLEFREQEALANFVGCQK